MKNSFRILKGMVFMSLLINSCRKRNMVLGILFSFFSIISAGGIKRADFFDASNNHLMFINFAEDGNSYEVLMSDSTFVRSVNLTKKDGKNEKAVSLNFNQDTSIITTFTYDGDNTSISVRDRHCKKPEEAIDELGGKVNFKASGDSYEVSQNGTAFNKINYEKSGSGDYNRINVTDNSGTLMYYVTLSTTGIARLRSTLKADNLAALYSKGNNCFELKLRLQESAKVSCDLFSLSGRNVSKIFSRDVIAGSSKETIRIGKGDIANGVYLLSLTINGRKVLNEKVLIQGNKGGF